MLVSATSKMTYVTFSRPYLHMYKHSNEQEEIGIISLDGVNVESNPDTEALLGVSIPNRNVSRFGN